MAFLLLPFHMLAPVHTLTPGVSLCVLISFSYKDTNPAGLGPTWWLRFNLISSLKAVSPNSVTFWGVGVRASTYEWGDIIQFITYIYITIYSIFWTFLPLSLITLCFFLWVLYSVWKSLMRKNICEDAVLVKLVEQHKEPGRKHISQDWRPIVKWPKSH